MNLLQWNCAERRSQRTLGICRTAPKSPSNATIRVIFDPRGRSDTSLFVRFAPKATFTNQDVIRRFVPQADIRIAANMTAVRADQSAPAAVNAERALGDARNRIKSLPASGD
jgi:Flp pilus assembly secretin CpaC